ncbi:MAG TPA: FecR family protein [Terriglobales bacterium]|nr:FecR family protein [Terriglobales bacterium]
MTRLRVVFALASATILSFAFPTSSMADSQVRMVRLSQVQGTVQIDRNMGNGFEKALPNMPITQGVRIQTGADGRAEVELESGTTVRLASDTRMAFPVLVLRDSGARASTAQLTLGTAYFNVRHKGKEEFRVAFAKEAFQVDRNVRFRVVADLAKATVSVFNGELKVATTTQTAVLKKDETMTFDLLDQTQVAQAKGIATLPSDNWDAERAQFDKLYGGSPYASTPYWNAPDLAYYGSYSFVPGYGMLWQPFGMFAGWNPYMNGAWVWDASLGYTYASMDPWGWIPYHYGAWTYVNGYGWGWAPTGPHTWAPTPRIIHQPAGFQVPTPPVVARAAFTGQSQGPAAVIQPVRTGAGVGQQPQTRLSVAARPTVIVGHTATAVGLPAAAFGSRSMMYMQSRGVGYAGPAYGRSYGAMGAGMGRAGMAAAGGGGYGGRAMGGGGGFSHGAAAGMGGGGGGARGGNPR